MSAQQVLFGDCLEQLKALAEHSVDSVVTDPPYGLKFMGKRWDYTVPSVEVWREVLRVLKPGGHLLSFGGTRTYHRMVVAIEDAGFEIRDQIQWNFGSGFPKSHDIHKACLKGKLICECPDELRGMQKADHEMGMLGQTTEECDVQSRPQACGSCGKPILQKGLGTALKPANEPIVLARKPLEHGHTIAENVLKHGVGALNIDASRIAGEPWKSHTATGLGSVKFFTEGETKEIEKHPHSQGRWPANVIFDECAAEMLDEQSGVSKSVGGAFKNKSNIMQSTLDNKTGNSIKGNPGFGDTSRFFKVISESNNDSNIACALNAENQLNLDDNFVQRLALELLHLASEAKSQNNNVNAHSAQNSLNGILETSQASTSSVQKNVTPYLDSISLYLNAKSAGETATNIAINIAQRLAALQTETIQELIAGLDFITDYRKCIPHLNLASIADSQASIDTTQTTLNFLRLFGCALHVISEHTFSAQSAGINVSGPTRFKYQAKASKRERNLGMGDAVNNHCTVKPVALMEYLIRLITPPGGLVLDPFCGSGSTGVAAKKLGFEFIGVELNKEYCEIARKRLAGVSP